MSEPRPVNLAATSAGVGGSEQRGGADIASSRAEPAVLPDSGAEARADISVDHWFVRPHGRKHPPATADKGRSGKRRPQK